MDIITLLDYYKQNIINERDQGTAFEKVVKHYFLHDPQYKNVFSDVWLWEEYPNKKSSDCGIDLVAKEINGGLCAIQCKFYKKDKRIEKSDLDSFFTASGKEGFTSRIIVTTTDKWSKKAEEAIEDQLIPVSRIDIYTLESSNIDWQAYHTQGKISYKEPKKQLKEHQIKAVNDVIVGFKTSNRGRLVMACGTGKTFTSLKIMEQIVTPGDTVLFLVPSLTLLSQTHKEWSEQTSLNLKQLIVCSDSKTGKEEDSKLIDLAFPATTNYKNLIKYGKATPNEVVVIYSTYHSLKVIKEAQKEGFQEIDLVICDEAHRTSGSENSSFTSIHDPNYIRAKKRLYMTATPRIYSPEIKAKASEHNINIYSMDDESKYGKLFHTLSFGTAVEKNLLTDYKVLILTIAEEHISKAMMNILAQEEKEINIDDIGKIIGCWNGLSKQIENEEDKDPMKRAVAFVSTIKNSQKITLEFSQVVEHYKANVESNNILDCQLNHIDGKMNAFQRKKLLNWLQQEPQKNSCHLLINAKCLSEGIDVPTLDAVLFLQPKKSQVDIIQAVGRVMRKAPNKKLGYIILPIVVPHNIPPEEALNNNEKYDVVWQVLQALRSHDERLNILINSLALNKNTKNDKISIIGVGSGSSENEENPENIENIENNSNLTQQTQQLTLNFAQLAQYKEAIYAKIVEKCGTRTYWDQWAKDVANIAQTNILRITHIIEQNENAKQAFSNFLTALQENINNTITKEEAIEMLGQHMVTKPVFNALFTNYDFATHNIISKEMQAIVDIISSHNLHNETQNLQNFYQSVKNRVASITNVEGQQKIIIELYDKFFKTAFPKMAQRLGIVYTPIEIVDFIINSVEHILKTEFNTSLSNKNVNILDPFTGTGTFITRLLQSGLIKSEDLEYKYKNEIHANEIVLLAYYIASINIETVYHHLVKQNHYTPFPGIVLTDTFNMYEKPELLKNILPENSKRIEKQKNTPVKVIMGNPPYSAGQKTENDNNKNIKYPLLDQNLANTYVKLSTAILNKTLYDTYIKALRWATDRLENKPGIIAFVTNGSFITGNAADGLRKSLTQEFNKIYCFNLKGNFRAFNKNEGENVFGNVAGTTIAINILVKTNTHTPCQVYYHDIGNRLKRLEKLNIIKEFNNLSNIPWATITPNNKGEWLNQRNNPEYEKFISLGNKKAKNTTKNIFNNFTLGVATNRDAWVYNFSKEKLIFNMQNTINFYNSELTRLQNLPPENKENLNIDNFVNNDNTKISWSRDVKNNLKKENPLYFNPQNIITSLYRPFCKQFLYYGKNFNEEIYQLPHIFPTPNHNNIAIGVIGKGGNKSFSPFITNIIPDLEIITKAQWFPLYTYEKISSSSDNFFNTTNPSPKEEYIKKENISNEILLDFQKAYNNPTITKEDIFYYIYGLLHSPEYIKNYYDYLTKEIPRIPFVENFLAFSSAGKELAYLHLNYENIEEYNNLTIEKTFTEDCPQFYHVTKMKFANRNDKSTIVFNNYITIKDIPLEAYEYIVNGKPAIEWVMVRYQITTHKESKLVNDPNLYTREYKYIFNLLLKVINISIKSRNIINNLPPFIIKK